MYYYICFQKKKQASTLWIVLLFLSVTIREGNVDDRKPVHNITKNLVGKIYADKGYIDQNLFLTLYKRGLKMIHGIKKNMKNKLMDLQDKILLKKRSLIETLFDYLKNKIGLVLTRHLSPINAFVHILSTLLAYSFKKNKPSLKFNSFAALIQN